LEHKEHEAEGSDDACDENVEKVEEYIK